MLNALFELRCGVNRFARDDEVTHAVQFVNTALQQVLDSGCRFDAPVVDRDQQCLNLMTQVAHGRDPGHARTTFQRMQMTLELVHRLCRTLPDPIDKCPVRRLEQLGRLFREDRRDLNIIFGLFARSRDRRRRLGLNGRRCLWFR